MQSTINLKLASFVAAVALSFGFAMTTYAYTDLEVEIDIYDNGAEVEASYVNSDDETVEKEYTTDLTDEDEIVDELVEMLDDEEIDAEAITSSDEYDVETHEGEELTTEEDEAMEDAEEAISDAEEKIAEAQAYLDTLEDDSDEYISGDEKLETARGLLEDAETALAAEDYEAAEDAADDAKELAEEVYNDDEEEEGDDDDNSDFCERTKKAAGWGVAKKCVDNDDWEVNDKMADKVTRFSEMKNFGQTTDRAELQNQLRTLLELLIELLSAQMALKASA